MNQNFNKKYDDVVWEYDNDLLQVWKEGKTGASPCLNSTNNSDTGST